MKMQFFLKIYRQIDLSDHLLTFWSLVHFTVNNQKEGANLSYVKKVTRIIWRYHTAHNT